MAVPRRGHWRDVTPDRPSPDVRVLPLTPNYWPAVAEIYAAGIATGHATFETDAPTWERFDATRRDDCRSVAVDADGRVLGWVTAAPVSDRCAYAGVAEISLYVHPDVSGRGIGTLLGRAAIDSTERAGIWTISAGVFAENIASLRLFRALGFRTVGIRERLGLMTYGPLAGMWRDVVLLERRSPVVGVTQG